MVGELYPCFNHRTANIRCWDSRNLAQCNCQNVLVCPKTLMLSRLRCNTFAFCILLSRHGCPTIGQGSYSGDLSRIITSYKPQDNCLETILFGQSQIISRRPMGHVPRHLYWYADLGTSTRQSPCFVCGMLRPAASTQNLVGDYLPGIISNREVPYHSKGSGLEQIHVPLTL